MQELIDKYRDSKLSIDDIPIFPDFKPIELSDKDLFDRIFHDYQPDVSEMSFTSLFAWRGYYPVQWSVFSKYLLMYVETAEAGFHAVEPIGPSPRNRVVELMFDYLKNSLNVKVPRIERADRRLIEELSGESYAIIPDYDQYDYVYRIEDLIALKGNKYHAKKNHINRFTRNYEYSMEPIWSDNIEDCEDLLNRWCDYRVCRTNLEMQAECDATRDMLHHFEAMKLTGAAVRLDGRIEAFTMGEMLNVDTAVVHVEKANVEIPGLYPVINQYFCREYFSSVQWINREQDNGHPALRKAKKSYYPAFQVPKYKIIDSACER